MKKIRKYILPVLFMGFVTILALLTFVLPPKEYSENEKRILAPFPQFTAESVLSGTFQKELESYMADHLAGRDFFVGLNAYFDRLLGRNTLSDIYYCDGGYLINAPQRASSQSFEKNMANFERFSKECGIPSTLMIVPTAGYIMEDKLPPFHAQYRDDELFRLASELTPSLSFLDVRKSLYDAYADENTQVYYRTDHHLTSAGSHILYKEFCKNVGTSAPPETVYTVTEHDGFYGTTYSGSGYFLTEPDKIEIRDLGEDIKVTLEEKDSKASDTMFFLEHLGKKDMYPVFLDGNHGYVHIENTHSYGGNLLIIRDSYAQSFAPFLAHNYRNIYMLDMRYYRASMADFVKANNIDRILYLYGLNTLLTDESSSWLFFK